MPPLKILEKIQKYCDLYLPLYINQISKFVFFFQIKSHNRVFCFQTPFTIFFPKIFSFFLSSSKSCVAFYFGWGLKILKGPKSGLFLKGLKFAGPMGPNNPMELCSCITWHASCSGSPSSWPDLAQNMFSCVLLYVCTLVIKLTVMFPAG